MERALASVDALVAAIMTIGASWFMYASNEAAAEAIRLYGYNVDSGALEGIVAGCYCVPNAALFAIASLSIWRRWSIRWFAQAIAAIWLIAPVVWASVPWWKR